MVNKFSFPTIDLKYRFYIKVLSGMGIFRFMSMLLKHPIMDQSLTSEVPEFECLLMDYNSNIHYVFASTITRLNEVLVWMYNSFHTANESHSDHPIELVLPLDTIKDAHTYFNSEYQIGTSYQALQTTLQDTQKITDILFKEVIKYTRTLIQNISSKGKLKKIYACLDGVPPLAKMSEQKNRRYIGAILNNLERDISKQFRFTSTGDVFQIDLFHYRTMICCGTPLMDKIEQALFNLNLKDIDIEVSTMYSKGEGEHKIVNLLREGLPYDSYCIMSPDSDMIVLMGLLCSDTTLDKRKVYNFRIDYQDSHTYQFIDMHLLITRFINYFSQILTKSITKPMVSATLFMLFVFGNDFLPKLPMLDIKLHFDLVCEISLKLSHTGLKMIAKDQTLNYEFILAFFQELNRYYQSICIDHEINYSYANYQKVCDNLSLSNEYLDLYRHHSKIHQIRVTYSNFNVYRNMVITAFGRLKHFLQSNVVYIHKLNTFISTFHRNVADSYFLLVMSRIVKFPGSNQFRNSAPEDFYRKIVCYMNSTGDTKSVRLEVNLISRNWNYTPTESETPFQAEQFKLAKSLEPYRTMFGVRPVSIVRYDLNRNKVTDHTESYYTTYFHLNITPDDIAKIILDYMLGIEWLYAYYITKPPKLPDWSYPHNLAPLLSDLVSDLETNWLGCQSNLANILKTYPVRDITTLENYHLITPNDYTGAGVSPNLVDVQNHIDGSGVIYLNKCQIRIGTKSNKKLRIK